MENEGAQAKLGRVRGAASAMNPHGVGKGVSTAISVPGPIGLPPHRGRFGLSAATLRVEIRDPY